MNLKLIFISLLWGGILLSCEKDKPLITENTDVMLLSRILVNNEPNHEYTYNSLNLLTEEKSKWYYTRHNYNDNNQLGSSEFYVDEGIFSSAGTIAEASWNRTEWVTPDNTERFGYRTFSYDNNGLLVKSVNYQYISPANNETRYSYDDNNRIIKITFYTENKVSGYIDYYYDGRSNQIKSVHYFVTDSGAAQLASTTEYEFDNKPNAYLSFKRLMTPGINTNQNNIIKETYSVNLEIGQPGQSTQVIETTYEYNESGYPVSKNGVYEYEYMNPGP